jgi:hypothetical protein
LLYFCNISFDSKDFENFELFNINYCKNFKNLMLRFNMNISDINDMENVHMLCDYDVRVWELKLGHPARIYGLFLHSIPAFWLQMCWASTRALLDIKFSLTLFIHIEIDVFLIVYLNSLHAIKKVGKFSFNCFNYVCGFKLTFFERFFESFYLISIDILCKKFKL